MPTTEEIEQFSRKIRVRSIEHGISLWEALNDYTEQTGMEPQVAASLLSKPLKADLMCECEDLNLLKDRGRKTAKLPI